MQHLKRLQHFLAGCWHWLCESTKPGGDWANVEEVCEQFSDSEFKRLLAERDRLQTEVTRLRQSLKLRDQMIATLIDEYDQTLAAEGKKEPAAGPAESSI